MTRGKLPYPTRIRTRDLLYARCVLYHWAMGPDQMVIWLLSVKLSYDLNNSIMHHFAVRLLTQHVYTGGNSPVQRRGVRGARRPVHQGRDGRVQAGVRRDVRARPESWKWPGGHVEGRLCFQGMRRSLFHSPAYVLSLVQTWISLIASVKQLCELLTYWLEQPSANLPCSGKLYAEFIVDWPQVTSCIVQDFPVCASNTALPHATGYMIMSLHNSVCSKSYSVSFERVGHTVQNCIKSAPCRSAHLQGTRFRCWKLFEASRILWPYCIGNITQPCSK